MGFYPPKEVGSEKKKLEWIIKTRPPRRFVRFVNTGYFVVQKIFYNSDFKVLRRSDAFMFFIFMSYHFLANCSREGRAQDETAFTIRFPFTGNRADASQRCYKIYSNGRTIIHDLYQVRSTTVRMDVAHHVHIEQSYQFDSGFIFIPFYL